jgi:hypothetical protein
MTPPDADAHGSTETTTVARRGSGSGQLSPICHRMIRKIFLNRLFGAGTFHINRAVRRSIRLQPFVSPA